MARKIECAELREALKSLPLVARRRFLLHHLEGLLFKALARLEAQLRQQFRATDPEFLAQAAELKKAHDREAQAQFSNDLKTIRAAYPDEKAQKVEELGIEFLKLCAGGISPLVAYEAIRNEKARSAANPPSMGDVKTSPTTEKEFFTRAEVAAMDQATVSRYFDKIRKSQQYWK